MTDNPLKQYFRRPAVYLKLPSGGEGYPEGTLDLPESGEIPIYPMTAIDEITSRTPDALFNGSAVVEIIKSCVPAIKDPWFVTNIDLDPILVAIRTATNGNLMEIETECPECTEPAKFDVNLGHILAGFKPGDYSKPLVVGELSIKFKPLSFVEVNKVSMTQFEIQKAMQAMLSIENEEERNKQSSGVLQTINDTYMELIISTIEYIKAPTGTVFEKEFIEEFLRNCDRNTYESIKGYSVTLRESTETKPLEITCPHCQHQYEQKFSINVSDFFD